MSDDELMPEDPLIIIETLDTEGRQVIWGQPREFAQETADRFAYVLQQINVADAPPIQVNMEGGQSFLMDASSIYPVLEQLWRALR